MRERKGETDRESEMEWDRKKDERKSWGGGKTKVKLDQARESEKGRREGKKESLTEKETDKAERWGERQCGR